MKNSYDVNDKILDTTPTKNSGEFNFEINEKNPQIGVHISCHIILNQCRSSLCRKNTRLMVAANINLFCSIATRPRKSILLVYPEKMMFPIIFYEMTKDGSIVGSIPAPLLSETMFRYLFSSIAQHVHSRLTSSSHSISNDPR